MEAQELRDNGHGVAASCLATFGDEGFVLAARIDGPALVVSGVGGKVEDGETFRQAVLREFREETGATVRLREARSTETLGERCVDVTVAGSPAAVVLSRPPGHPSGGVLAIAVFLGELDHPPQALEKVEYFPLLTPASWRQTPGELPLRSLRLLRGGVPVDARDVLPLQVDRVEAVDTARAVLERPDLLEQWWSWARRRLR